MLHHALRYARFGYPVLPLEPRGRRPLIEGWPGFATTDEDDIRAWWRQWPDANIGLLLVPDAPIMVLDIEGSDGHAIAGTDAWIEIGVALATAHPTQKTPSGGFHVFGRAPDEIPEFGRNLRPGIEIFGERCRTKYVIAAPSVVDADEDRGKPAGTYEWTQDLVEVGDLPEFPAEMFHGMQTPEDGGERRPPRERDGFDAAVDAYNAERPLSLPRGTRRVECPICGSKGCWGRLSKRDDRWACWSETHKREFPDVGVRMKDGDGMYGDALDLDCHRTGKSRREMLKESGHLKDLPTQIERYGKRPRKDAPDGGDGEDEEPLARVWVHGMHEHGYVTPSEFGSACLDELPEFTVFKHGETLRIITGEEMPALDHAGMMNVVGQYVSLLDTRWRKGNATPVLQNWAKHYVSPVIARAMHGHDLVHPLIERTTVPLPIFDDDGNLRFLRAGYNAPGYYLDGGDCVDAIMEPVKIWQVLESVVGTFPFAAFPGEYEGNTAESSMVNAIAHMMTVFTRRIINGHRPLFAYMAPSASTGKTSLAQAISMAASGKDAMLHALEYREKDFKEFVTATLARPASPCVVFDNVRSDEPFKHSALESLLTTETWGDRAKYDRESKNFLNNLVWAMTVQTGTSLNLDLSTRCVGIYLDANVERPQDRLFANDPVESAKAIHGDVVAALTGAVMLWDAAGRPARPPEIDVGCRFGEWNRVVGGILYVLGRNIGAAMNANAKAFQQHSHASDDPFTILCEAWASRLTGVPLKVGEILTKVVDAEDLDIGSHGESPQKLARLLKQNLNRRIAGRKLVRRRYGGTFRWILQDIT